MIACVYGLMHFFVDLICAWAMFSRFRFDADGYFQVLVYNFCAFALQMPLGALLDVARSRSTGKLREVLAPVWTCAGICLTVLGVFTRPWILGTGNALFHVGGGMDVLLEDRSRRHRGKSLGVFVAPGALGLYLGTVLGSSGEPGGVSWAALSAAVLFILMLRVRHSGETGQEAAAGPETAGTEPLLPVLCCFLAVILRSWTGFQTGFAWKQQPLLAWAGVFAVALGKMAGGFLSARFGMKRTLGMSLLLAAAGFLAGEDPALGLGALFVFNMSMPVTLYLVAEVLPELPGFSFGLLTFGLFIGFLPVYWQLPFPPGPEIGGFLGSGLTLGVLMLCRRWMDRDRISV